MKNQILLVIALLLGLLVWWSQPSSVPPLSQLSPETITRIEISQNQDKRLVLTRQGTHWEIENQPANSVRVEQFLKLCQTPSLHRFKAPEALQPYGLANPNLVLHLNQERFAFGGTDPLHGWRYVLYHDTVHLIGDGFQHHLTAPASGWMENPDA
jgi:hypothetical protein